MEDDKQNDEQAPPPTNTGYIRSEDSWTRWRNTFALLTGNLTPEGRRQYREDRDLRFEKEDCKRCESYRDYLLKYSPIIRFMSEKINQLHGDLNQANIRCRRCTRRWGGGFSPEYGIMICANEVRSRGHMEDTMAHEMVHAYDHLRFKLERMSLRHTACTEIRASNLSGECRFTREFFGKRQWRITEQHQECVRRRATLSVQNHPLCKDKEHADNVVNEVWESCFADTRPFDEIYR